MTRLHHIAERAGAGARAAAITAAVVGLLTIGGCQASGGAALGDGSATAGTPAAAATPEPTDAGDNVRQPTGDDEAPLETERSSEDIADTIGATDGSVLFRSDGSGALLELSVGLANGLMDELGDALEARDEAAVDAMIDNGIADRDEFVERGYITTDGAITPTAAATFAEDRRQHDTTFDRQFERELKKARRDMRSRYGAAVHELGGASLDGRPMLIVVFERDVSEWNPENLCAEGSQEDTLFILGSDYFVAGEESMSPLGDRVFMRNLLARLHDDGYDGELVVVDCASSSIDDVEADGPDADGTMEYTGPPLQPNETWMDADGFMWIGDENGNPVNMGQGQ